MGVRLQPSTPSDPYFFSPCRDPTNARTWSREAAASLTYHMKALAFHLVLASAAVAGVAGVAAAQPAKPIRVDLARDRVGAEPTSFLPMVGNWVVTTDGGRKVVMVDGRAWKKGQAAGGLADKARAIYGASHEEFLDNVKAFAYFPIAVAKGIDDFHDGDVALRFKLIGGTLDRCAGILFD